MAKIPCVPQARIFTIKETGETMSYDQVRQYLMSNPDLWLGKGEQKAEGKKASPFTSIQATAKALEGVDTSKIIKPLSEKEFDKKYIAQHKDLKGKREGNWQSNKAQILKNGLKEGFNVNALPIYTGSETNVIDKQYGNREGDIVYILPKEGVTKGRNGYKTKEGYTPKLSEIIVVEYDKQPTYEAYKNQLKSLSYISETYHAAKKDGSNPELVKAVEDLLGGKQKTETQKALSPEQELKLLAPNGKPSNLTPTQHRQVRTPEFKKWFGDWENDPKNASKVVDENGEPLVVYHGTDRDIDVFNKENRRNIRSNEVQGYWFTDSKKNAELYSFKRYQDESSSPTIIEAFLNIRKPLDVNFKNINRNITHSELDDDLSKLSKRFKNDGVIKRGFKDKILSDNFVVLAPNQIKSATENTGAFNPESNNIRDIIEDSVLGGTNLSPEQELKQAFDKWKAENNKVGIVPNWEKQAKADIELFQAVGTYLAKKLEKGIYSFEKFISDLGTINIEKIDEQRAKWKGFYDDAVAKAKAQQPPVTPPPTTPPTEEGKELPEAPEGQVPKKVVERRYKADSPEVQQALEDIGLFRTPGNIEDAQKKASQLVAQVGVDAALDVARNESVDGLYKIGIMGAVLEDIENRRAATNDPEEFVRLTNEAARITNEASNYLTTAGQELRMWQEILQNKDLPFEYTSRKKAFVEQFGEEAFTKEVEERFESLNTQYQEALSKINDLEQQKANWERQSLVDDVANEKAEEPAKRKSFFKQAAERVRKLAFSKPGIFSSATPASLAWDASIEAVALALDGLGTLEVAIGKGIDKLRSTDWYRGLSNSKKSEAEKSFKEEVEKAYIPTVSVDDAGKVVIPEGTLKAYVEAGFRDAEEITDHIYNQLIKDNPNLTKRDVRDAISGYGRKYNPTPNQVRDQINEIKAIGKLISGIEDAQNKIEKTTNPKVKKDLSDRLKALKEQYEAAYMNSFGRKPTQPSEATRYATVKRNMEKEIERLRAMKPRPERRPPVDYDAQLEALATEKFRLQEEWDAEFSKQEQKQRGTGALIGDVAYGLTQLPKSVMAGGFDLGMLLIQGSMLSVSDLPTTGQAAKNLGKALISEKEYQNQIGKIRNSELYRIIRKSGLDLTIPFGKTLLAEETGIDTLAESLFNLLITPLKYIPEYGPKSYEFAKRFNFIRALNRAQTAYMNTLRVGTFLIDVQNMQEKGITFYNNPNAYKEAAQGINTMSGRGDLFGAEKSKIVMRALNIAFFSPKNWSSILRLFTPIGLAIELGTKRSGAEPYKMSVAQARIIKTFAKYVAGTSLGILGVAALSGEDEDEEKKKETGNVSVDLKNPQSSAFGKIRVGNQIFDPWGGKMQIITLQARLLIHAMGGYAYKDPFTGIEKKLQDSYFKTPGNLVGEYVKGKFAPSLRAPWQLANSVAVPGRPGYYRPIEGGKEFYIFEPFAESYENLTIKALQETYGQQPLGVSEIAALMIIAGGGVTTLNDQEDITTVTKIQNLLSPGEGEVKKFKKAFSSYLKAGDFDMAEKVFDKATGSYQLNQTIQQQQEAGKAVGDVQRQLARKRKQSVKDLFENIREDNLVQKYTFEKRYRDEIIEAVYNDKMLSTSGVSPKKQQMFERINALTPEMKEDIKRNYDLQYEELMTVTQGLDKVAERADNYYEKKAKRTPWVKQYLRLTGKEEKK